MIHISDVPFVFNDAQDLGLGISSANNVTQTRMSGSWARFVASGDPSGPSAESSIAGWSQAQIKGQGNDTTGQQTVTGASVTKMCFY